MAEELLKFGVKVLMEDDKITIEKTSLCKPDAPLCGHNDHRIVMALSLLLTLTGGSIDGAEAVSKSFPSFFDKLKKLGITVECE